MFYFLKIFSGLKVGIETRYFVSVQRLESKSRSVEIRDKKRKDSARAPVFCFGRTKRPSQFLLGKTPTDYAYLHGQAHKLNCKKKFCGATARGHTEFKGKPYERLHCKARHRHQPVYH